MEWLPFAPEKHKESLVGKTRERVTLNIFARLTFKAWQEI
jgi:hypothetical protein